MIFKGTGVGSQMASGRLKFINKGAKSSTPEAKIGTKEEEKQKQSLKE